MREFTYGFQEEHLSGTAIIEVELTQTLANVENPVAYGAKTVAYVNMERPWSAWRLKRVRRRAQRMADKANAREERWDVEFEENE